MTQVEEEEAVLDKDKFHYTFLEKVLDRLEGLEETVDRQEQTISTLNEKIDHLESKLIEENRKSAERSYVCMDYFQEKPFLSCKK